MGVLSVFFVFVASFIAICNNLYVCIFPGASWHTAFIRYSLFHLISPPSVEMRLRNSLVVGSPGALNTSLAREVSPGLEHSPDVFHGCSGTAGITSFIDLRIW